MTAVAIEPTPSDDLFGRSSPRIDLKKMSSSRPANPERDESVRMGFKSPPPGFRGPRGPSPSAGVGPGPPYGYKHGPPGPPPQESYSRAEVSARAMPPPKYGPPKKGSYKGESPAPDDYFEKGYPPERRYAPPGDYDRYYDTSPGRYRYDHPPYDSRYDRPPPPKLTSPPRGRYVPPSYEYPRRSPDIETMRLKKIRSTSPAPKDSNEEEKVAPKAKARPRMPYPEEEELRYYYRRGSPGPSPGPRASPLPPRGSPLPMKRGPPPIYDRSYPPPYAHPEYEAERRWSGSREISRRERATHEEAVMGRYEMYDRRSRDYGPPPIRRSRSGDSYDDATDAYYYHRKYAPRYHGERRGSRYEYEERPEYLEERRPLPKAEVDKVKPDEASSVYEREEAKEEVSNRVDTPAETEVMPSEPGPEPSEIIAIHRDEVANMGCTCKKSKCLKLYCQCFAASVMCGPNCRCLICHNTPDHELARKDAIRAVLARNPHAFDIKVKSATTKNKSKIGGKFIAHRSGCKCRKSGCLKKYCECYLYGAKCTANCRCVGCQNMPPGGFENSPDPENSVKARSFLADVYSAKEDHKAQLEHELLGAPPPRRQKRKGEQWMEEAAGNLAGMKNPKRQDAEDEGQDLSSMPSLASSEAAPSPEQVVTSVSAHRSRRALKKPLPTRSKKPGKVNELLMAAFAMTELQTNSSSKDEEGEERDTPHAPRRKTDFRSPKRKAVGDAGSQDGLADSSQSGSKFGDSVDMQQQESAEGGSPMTESPDDHRTVKRSRLDSADRVPSGKGGFLIQSKPAKSPTSMTTPAKEHLKPLPEKDQTPATQVATSDESEGDCDREDGIMQDRDETPAKPEEKPSPKRTSIEDLTPVSKRCIDFRKMDVNGDGNGDSSGVDIEIETESKKENHKEMKSQAMDTTSAEEEKEARAIDTSAAASEQD